MLMAAQLFLFPGILPVEALEAPPAPEPVVPAHPAPAPLSPSQMGLFDAQVRRLRAALDAVAAGDLLGALSLLAELTSEVDPVVPSLRQRVAEVHRDLERCGALPWSARIPAQLELGRRLSVESRPWSSLGRTLIARAAAALGPAEGVLAGRLFMEAGQLETARTALRAVPGPRTAAALFALGDLETARNDRSAAREHYRDAILLDPFHAAFDGVADEEVRGLPYVAELEVEVDGDPRPWCGPVGIVMGTLPRPRQLLGELSMPADAPTDRSMALARAREFVDALVRAASPDASRNREAVLDTRRAMKRASAPLFAWYMARLSGAS
jgi:hypothetical protein